MRKRNEERKKERDRDREGGGEGGHNPKLQTYEIQFVTMQCILRFPSARVG